MGGKITDKTLRNSGISTSESVLNKAVELHRAGQIYGAYNVLETAVDQYANSAQYIVDDGNFFDVFGYAVDSIWEHSAPESVATSWRAVAAQNQENRAGCPLTNRQPNR